MFEQRILRPAILLSLSSRDLRADSLIGVRIYGPGSKYGNLQFSFCFLFFWAGSFEAFFTYGTWLDNISREQVPLLQHWMYMYIYKGQIPSVDRN